jgi:hypothetical protein
MSTASLVINANQSGVAYTGDLNNALEAINTCHSGNSAPTNQVVSGKFWLDTSGTNPILKIYRNGWKSLFTLKSGSVETSINALTTSTLSVSSTSTFTGLLTASSGVAGNLTGNVSGNVTGNLTGNVTGNVTGNLTGNVTGDVTGDVTGATITLSGNISAVDGTFSGDVSADDFNSTSDKRLKSNIKPLNDALQKVKQLKGVSFEMDNKQKIGVIAQEIQKVIPEVVNTKEDGYLSVSYGNIVGLLIEAIKEQQVKIEQLEQKLGDS